MIYPDEEKVTYSYNLGGLLEKVRGEKSYGYDYITKLGYDKFEQRSYLKYCNGSETFYTYDDRRRLSNLAVNSGGTSIMDNAYTFDAVSNVLSVANNASLPANGNAGGQMSHTYTYDGLYRLATATGTYTGADNKSASYTLAMGYDNMHRIKSKSQHLTQDNVQFNGTLNVGYDLTYTYGSEAGKKFQLESVKDVNYRTEETPEGQQVENGHGYTYDKNGNLVYVNTSRMMTDGHRDNSVGERKLIWDEENRLLAVDDNGFVSNYWYDADGERTVKTSGESDQVYVNGVFSGGSTNTAKFSLYVSPYLVANQGGRYTKHIYAGSQRIVSKVGDFASYGSDPRRIEYAGANTDGLSVDYKSKYAAQQQVIRDNYKFFDVPYNGTDNDNYADGEGFCCNDGSMEAAVAEARKTQIRAVSRSFKDPDNYENLQFFYHPDHLGSSSFITNLDGEVVQHIEYVPFGEVFIEERNNVWNTPYLFNAKEFDEETGLYYYGARYYNPRLSIWISPDNLQEKLPEFSTYTYTHNNPIKYIDPDGNIPVETVWDAANVALGVSTLIDNIKQGNVGAAVVDGLGVIVDAAATVVPYVPGLVQELNPIGLVKLWLILLRQLKQQLMPQKQLRLQKQLKPQLKVHPTLQEEPLLGRLKEMQEYQQVKISKPIPKEMLRKMEEAGVKVLNMNLTFQLHMDLKKVDSCRIISKVISIWMVELIILLISIFIKNKERLN
nr:RHS repeat-associated core domain-containing protein [Bacteroides acidifaciens]